MSNTLVLLSGGIDSTVALGSTLRNTQHVETVSIDYGQGNRAEIDAAAAISAGFGAACHHVLRGGADPDLLRSLAVSNVASVAEVPDLPSNSLPSAFVRDLGLLSNAIGVALSRDADELVLGCSAERYEGLLVDRIEYRRALEAVARIVASEHRGQYREIDISFPFMDHSRQEVIGLAQEIGLDLAGTVSCDVAREADRCGRCAGCRLRDQQPPTFRPNASTS